MTGCWDFYEIVDLATIQVYIYIYCNDIYIYNICICIYIYTYISYNTCLITNPRKDRTVFPAADAVSQRFDHWAIGSWKVMHW